MKKLLSLLLVAAMGLSLVGCGGSDNGSKSESKSDLEYVKNKGTLVVGVTDFAPMDYKDESGNWIGFDADMASAFAESLGVKAEFVEIDWDNIEDMNYENEFDAVWACASMLHVDKGDMIKMFAKVMKALKIGGVFYASWKYGKGEQTRDDGRTFANYTETKVCDMVYSVSGAVLEDVWTSQDVRTDRTGQGHLWVNVLVKKTRVVITEKEFLNIFWKQYQIIEKDVRISSEYVDIHKSNFSTFSSRYINMFLNICSNIDSLIEIYCKIVEEDDYRKKYSIHDRLTPVLRKFPDIRLDAVRTIDTFEDIELKPFSAFVGDRIADWWNDYNLVKHARSDRNEKTGMYNFQRANQKNVLTAMAAYFIVCNRIYEEICEISATPKRLLKSKIFLYAKNGE